MLAGARIGVVVPARNEARWIGETVATVPAFVDHVIVVDDASTDATGELAHARGGARAEVVRHAARRGVGGAIVTGYRRAVALGCDVVAVMAGDGQMHPDDLELIASPVARGEVDYAKGDRLSHPLAGTAMPAARRVAGGVLSALTRWAAGLERLSDSQSGFTAISARALGRLDLDRIWPGYGYPNDLLGALARAGFSIRDVVVRPVYRGEKSGLRPWHVLVVGGIIARVAIRRRAGLARRTRTTAAR